MQVMVDGLLTRYEKAGAGKVVVLLHGWAKGEATFGPLTRDLARQFTVLTLALPGFGGTAQPPVAWDLHDYAAFVGHFLRKIDAEPVYAIVGHSNGGAIAIRGLGSGVLHADRLVLLASAGVRSTYGKQKLLIRLAGKTGKVLSLPLPSSVRRGLRRRFHQAISSDLLVAEHLEGTFTKIVRDDVQADAAKIAIPTLLLYGEKDTATPVAFGELLHQLISGSTLEVVPDAGHFVFLDAPVEVSTRVLEFLR